MFETHEGVRLRSTHQTSGDTMQDDFDYYLNRAATERELSAAASDPTAALIHAKLAERYERLASHERNDSRPTLHIVTP